MAHVTVMEWERVLAFVDGSLRRVLGPGRHRYNRRRTELVTTDMRPRLLTVPGQEVITSDGVSVRASLTTLWQVDDAVAFTTGAEAPIQVLYAAVQEAIRSRAAGIALEHALGNRAALSEGLADAVRGEVAELGIKIVEVRVRDLMLPGELRRAAMDVVVARERGRAALEEARAEAAALRSLANTARLLDEHPVLLQLRTLQVAAEKDTSVVLDRPAPA